MTRLIPSFLLAVGVVLALSFGAQQASAAPPDPDVYNIAVLEVGDFSDWDNSEFQALSQAPGIFTFTWTTIPTSALTSAGLAPFNVLIVPWDDEDQSWKTAGAVAAIADWVNAGGTLIEHAPDDFVGSDALFGGFGPDYAISWIDVDDDPVTITDAANPLVTFPNPLSGPDLSGWGQSFHGLVSSSGSAWQWAARGSGDEGGVGDVLGCAVFGEGAIVVSGFDPESHADERPEGFLLIENEIVVNREGICAGGGGTLTITKSCPNGAGDGDADFQILVSQLEDSVAADSLDCNESLVIEDLEDGSYTIHEFITGPDANNFLTAIACSTEEGQTVTAGTLATVVIEGLDVECDVINVFNPPVAPADPNAPGGLPGGSVIVPIDLDNTNDNALNNDNLNTNNNENTNAQDQSNFQEQINDNNQTTTVNSSPSVVIDFDD